MDRRPFRGYIATFVRHGKQRTGQIKLSPELAGKLFDVYVLLCGAYEISASSKLQSLVPWVKGVYSVLACDAQTCWMVAATRM